MTVWVGFLFTPEWADEAESEAAPDSKRLAAEQVVVPGGNRSQTNKGWADKKEHLSQGEQREPILLQPERSPGGKPDDAFNPSSLIRRLLGVDVRSATFPDLSRYRLVGRGAVVIVFADRHGPLAALGFEAGDMIVEVEGLPINGFQEFAEQILRLRGKKSVLLLGMDHRTGRSGYVQVVVP